MRLRATAVAEGTGGRGGPLGLLMLALVVLVSVAALVVFLAQLRQTVLLGDPGVRAAQARQSIAESEHQTAQLQKDTASIRAQSAAEAGWQPWIVGAQRIALLALLVAVPVLVAAVLIAGALVFRRHLSLPTQDGRVPLVGLDRDLSREALLRYQELRRGYEVLSPPRRLRGGELEAEGWGTGTERQGDGPTVALDPQRTE